MCAQTVWHLVCALGVSAHPFHSSKEACHWTLISPAGSLPGAHLLSVSCAWSFPWTAQGAPSVELHTHTQARMPVSPGSEIGQEAGLETPLLSLSDALVSPAAYFSPLALTFRQLPSPQTQTHPDMLTVVNLCQSWFRLTLLLMQFFDSYIECVLEHLNTISPVSIAPPSHGRTCQAEKCRFF